MAFEHYIYTGTTRLRCGYTTGSCAALAAKAACEMLLSRKPVGRVSIVTPGGLPVEADVDDACIGEGCAQCAVRKDAGDDADVTDGVRHYMVDDRPFHLRIRGERPFRLELAELLLTARA